VYKSCLCADCLLLSRDARPRWPRWDMIDPPGAPTVCILMQNFAKICHSLGLVVKHNPAAGKAFFPLSMSEFKYDCTVYNVPDCDIFFGTQGGWDTIGYGQRIADEAHKSSSARIKSLKTLFRALALMRMAPSGTDEDDVDDEGMARDENVEELTDSEPDEPAQPVPASLPDSPVRSQSFH